MLELSVAQRAKELRLEEPSSSSAFFSDMQRGKLLDELDRYAASAHLPLFSAISNGKLVGVGTLRPHRVLAKSDAGVELSASHALHKLSAGIALEVGKTYELAIKPGTNEVLFARETARPPRELGGKPTPGKNAIEALKPLPAKKVSAFFQMLAQQPHIPFQYAANGCWARAHEMCRLIERYLDEDPSKVVAKVWNWGALEAKSANTPDCSVRWIYHVAPVLRLEDETLSVLDPSLASGPLELASWLKLQSDVQGSVSYSDMSVYFRSKNGADSSEGPNECEEDMATYRTDLIAQIYEYGPLPYSKCFS